MKYLVLLLALVAGSAAAQDSQNVRVVKALKARGCALTSANTLSVMRQSRVKEPYEVLQIYAANGLAQLDGQGRFRLRAELCALRFPGFWDLAYLTDQEMPAFIERAYQAQKCRARKWKLKDLYDAAIDQAAAEFRAPQPVPKFLREALRKTADRVHRTMVGNGQVQRRAGAYRMRLC